MAENKKIDNKSKLRRKFILEGLDCANCASKIEEKVATLSGIQLANVNFPTKTLTIEIEEDLEVKILEI